MSLSVPTNWVVYALGCLAVIVVVGGLGWAAMAVDRYITRREETKASREE
jgi:hypothetical protein